MAVEHIRRWKVGDVEVIRLVELWRFEDDVWVLLKDATPEHIQRHAWLAPRFATPEGRMLMNFQAFVVKTPTRLIMVDTCIGNGRKREYDVFTNLQGSFLEDLVAAGCPPERFDTVLCTHLHLDHCGWNTRLVDGKWAPTFPNARYLFGRTEVEYWRHRVAIGAEHTEHVDDAIEPIFAAGLADMVDPTHQVCEEISLEPTPGHTPGHVSVVITSKGQRAVISGDVLHHPVQLAEPGLVNNFDIDKEQAGQSRRDFIARHDDRKSLFIGSHFCDPTAGWIVRDGYAWRFETD